MNEQQMRMRCVELALQVSRDRSAPAIVETARLLAEFVLGTNDAEETSAARDPVGTVNGHG